MGDGAAADCLAELASEDDGQQIHGADSDGGEDLSDEASAGDASDDSAKSWAMTVSSAEGGEYQESAPASTPGVDADAETDADGFSGSDEGCLVVTKCQKSRYLRHL